MSATFDGKMICLVTGASQNLGASFAHAFALKMAPGSVLILSSRSADRLATVQQEIVKSVKDPIKVMLVEWDTKAPNADKFRHDIQNAVGTDVSSFQSAIIVHNAFQLGNLTKYVSDLKDPVELQEQLNINVVSPLVLNAIWLEIVKPVKNKIVVNVSAPSATKALPSFGLTAIGKSPVYLALSVLAKEHPEIKVLHFDPGMVDTDGLRQIRDTSHFNEIRAWIKSFYDKGELLEQDQSAQALIKILTDNAFQTGEYVSAYTAVAGKKGIPVV